LVLSQVVTDILHLQGQKLISYKGDYDTFERTRDERLRNQQKAFEANERTRGHIQVGLSSSPFLSSTFPVIFVRLSKYY
jgi:ATPase subunit of ABC transporter with duplicated ATPase domains